MAENRPRVYAEDNPSDSDLTLQHFTTQAPDFQVDVIQTGQACLVLPQFDPRLTPV